MIRSNYVNLLWVVNSKNKSINKTKCFLYRLQMSDFYWATLHHNSFQKWTDCQAVKGNNTKWCRYWSLNIHLLKPIKNLMGYKMHIMLILCNKRKSTVSNRLCKISFSDFKSCYMEIIFLKLTVVTESLGSKYYDWKHTSKCWQKGPLWGSN